jgi:hypothetical protein
MLPLNKHSIIRTIYLYLFALVGLVLLIIGTVRFIDMGLKAYVFTKAEQSETLQQRYYYSGPLPVEKMQNAEESSELTEDELIILKNFLADYKEWEEKESNIDYLASKRHREASGNLAMIIIGLPLYFYHWRIIRKETKESKEE